MSETSTVTNTDSFHSELLKGIGKVTMGSIRDEIKVSLCYFLLPLAKISNSSDRKHQPSHLSTV
jgi:hypothetical protein